MMLRIQLERMQGGFFPSLREYFTRVRDDRGPGAAWRSRT